MTMYQAWVQQGRSSSITSWIEKRHHKSLIGIPIFQKVLWSLHLMFQLYFLGIMQDPKIFDYSICTSWARTHKKEIHIFHPFIEKFVAKARKTNKIQFHISKCGPQNIYAFKFKGQQLRYIQEACFINYSSPQIRTIITKLHSSFSKSESDWGVLQFPTGGSIAFLKK